MEIICFKDSLILKTKTVIPVLLEREVSEVMKFVVMAIWGEKYPQMTRSVLLPANTINVVNSFSRLVDDKPMLP